MTKLTALQEREILKELHRREAILTQRNMASRPTEADLAKVSELLQVWGPEDVIAFRRQHGPASAPLGMGKDQKEFFFPAAQTSRFRVARCTRRAGKTTGAAIKILVTLLLDPRGVFLYIARTTSVCKEQVWVELRKLVAEHDLPFDFNETNLRMQHRRSQGRAIFRGADNVAQLDKLRGLKLVGAIVDEGGTFGAEMEKLVLSVVGPALLDLQGELLMIGTPGYFPEGLFYETSEGMRKSWARYRWTLMDNPFLHPKARDYDAICEEYGLTRDDPVFIREWLGEYCVNDSTQMFTYEPAKHSYRGAPPVDDLPLQYALGVDFGWTDATAITVLGWSARHKRMYAVESWSATKQTSDMVAAQLQRLMQKWGTKRIVGDTGGLGKQTSEQIWMDYGIYIEPAKKMEKLNHVSFMNAAFRADRLRVNFDDALSQELPKVLWNEQKTDSHNKAEDNRSHALLYVWRACQDQAGKSPPGERALSTLPGLEHWDEEELQAKLGASLATSADLPWYLRTY